MYGVSIDSLFSHLNWKKTPRKEGGLGEINFPLISDISKSLSQYFEVLVEEESDALYGATLRGIFIIDAKGVIRSMSINDEQVGRNVEETIRLIQAFQHADEHGVVCPANWKPGQKTIVPSPEASQKYFQEL